MPQEENRRLDGKNQNDEFDQKDVDHMTEDRISPDDRDTPLTHQGEVDTTPVDSYTHEPLPPFPEGDIPIEDMEVESFAELTSDIPLEDEDKAVDFLTIDAGSNTDAVMDQIDDYTDDPDIISDFAERQGLASGSDELLTGLLEETDKGPILSGGDIDADWSASDASGEESAGASVPTPDQSIVDDLGTALGITYDDDEELHSADKLGERDEDRYELDVESLEDYEDDLRTGEESREDDMDVDEF